MARALRRAAPQVGTAWATVWIDGWPYQALRVMGNDLDSADPIELLANGLPAARAALGDYTLVVAGMDFPAGPGSYSASAAHGPAGELLLDSTCAIAATGPQEFALELKRGEE